MTARSFDEAMVLRQTPFGESDAVVTLFTRTHGKISALARGARASKKRFAGALGLLVLSRVDLKRKPRGDLWSLDAAELAREWTGLAGDVAARTDAYFNHTRRVVQRFGDKRVTYAVFLRRPAISAPHLMLEWLEAIAAERGTKFEFDLRYAEGTWVGA
ncbi:MAG TPA: DNA repair protein RecO, partial [Kofleriaceae bacterium]|nr:DNA repair protein RecO [Kofleriaceae bacterium]